ncbi:hypothetical protein [Candidatus Methylopumilus rimovensis]|uniref:hypothetical protein n=1 Tax=Candidatus Methylopumilus rimovensis TaxID=2588535 RepID=UPI0011212FF2|nr:hypothetical protein [Candidatus Methylopumilus rimovensis]QDD11714.1 hypothetical protein FIT62_00790 [Candidatus Methylopumilus rimovensis]
MVQKSVIIVCRSESIDDFHQIARRAHRLDPSIAVIPIAEHLHSSLIPQSLLNLPMLVIFLVNPPQKEFALAGKMAVKRMTKLEEYEHFKKHNIPCLPIEAFTWGMTLDKSIYGDWVVLKPQNIQSTGKDVNMVPTDLIPSLTLEDFPADHLIRRDQYYVQKFVKTGEKPSHYRVLVFCGEVLYIRKVTSLIGFPNPQGNIKTLLSSSIASNVPDELRETSMLLDQKVFDFALKIAHTHYDLPLFGFDIVENKETDELICLEQNTGGNVWHFSSNLSKSTGANLPSITRAAELIDDKKVKINQYGAWDRAAEGLIRKTYELAK